MGGWVTRWFHVTLRLNPVFPLSALALLVGTYLLTQGQSLGGSSAQTLTGVAILEGFELCLLGVAAFALWPRRISYETVTILVMRGVLRFAPPFLVIGLAADGQLEAALLIGAGLVGLAVFKSELTNRRLDLELKLGARLYDTALYAFVTLLLPLLADRLALWTGGTLTHQAARLVELGSWWIGALALLPLALGVDGLGAGGPERRRRHTVAGRCVTLACTVGLLFNAVWLGGNPPTGLALVPLCLVGAVFLSRLAPDGALPRWLVHAPAAVVAAAVLAPAGLLLGPVAPVSHLVGCLVTLGVAAVAVPLIAPREHSAGFRSLAAVAALAPLRFVGGWLECEAYLLGLASIVTAIGLLRQSEWAATCGALACAAFGAHLAWVFSGDPLLPLAVLTMLGAGLAVMAGFLPIVRGVAHLAIALCVGAPLFATVHSAPGLVELAVQLSAAGALALLGWRHRRRLLLWVAGGLGLVLVGRSLAAAVEPGVLLVLLAFAGIPAGTGLAVHRERLRRKAAPPPELETATEPLPEPDAATHRANASGGRGGAEPPPRRA